MSILSDFIGTERTQYTTEGGNLFARSLGEVSRYYDYLLIIFDRSENISKEFIATVEKQREHRFKLTPRDLNGHISSQNEEIRLMDETNRLTTLFYLEQESFYIFAKIFLDKIPKFIRYYFGNSPGISLDRNSKWVKEHYEYLSEKGIDYPQSLTQTITFLTEQISRYRDKQIMHRKHLGIVPGIGWGDTKEAIMSPYPLSSDAPKNNIPLSGLMEEINKYINQLITIIKSNRTKSNFKLK